MAQARVTDRFAVHEVLVKGNVEGWLSVFPDGTAFMRWKVGHGHPWPTVTAAMRKYSQAFEGDIEFRQVVYHENKRMFRTNDRVTYKGLELVVTEDQVPGDVLVKVIPVCHGQESDDYRTVVSIPYTALKVRDSDDD